MIRKFLKRQIRKFGAKYDYDTGYMDEVCDHDPFALVKLAMARGFLEHRGPLSPAAWHTARLRSAREADCGPCLELAVKIAEEEGLDRGTIISILRGTVADPDLARIAAYTDAVLANVPDQTDHVETMRARYGTAGLNALSAAIVAGQFYPLYKRGLGHGISCIPVLRELEAV